MTSTEPTRNMAPTAVLPLTDLALMDPRTLGAHTATVNEVFDIARRAYENACENLGNLLTEQMTRHLVSQTPAARTLRTRYSADYHSDEYTGEPLPQCTGHQHRLVPVEVLDDSGTPITSIDQFSPVHYWLERISPLMMPADALLDLTNRSWSFPADDCQEPHEFLDGEPV